MDSKAGSGKTKLTSTVIDDILQHISNDEAFAYFYCDRNEPSHRELDSILRNFVRQLSTLRNTNAIPISTVAIYKENLRTGFASGKLKSKECHAILADLFEIYSQITIVLDALDECDRKTRLDFMHILDELIAQSSKPIKILISSRRDRDIRYHLKDCSNLEIRATDNRDDIAMYVNHEITAGETIWNCEISPELKSLLCITLVEKSEGM